MSVHSDPCGLTGKASPTPGPSAPSCRTVSRMSSIETDRLTIRPVIENDRARFVELFTDDAFTVFSDGVHDAESRGGRSSPTSRKSDWPSMLASNRNASGAYWMARQQPHTGRDGLVGYGAVSESVPSVLDSSGAYCAVSDVASITATSAEIGANTPA